GALVCKPQRPAEKVKSCCHISGCCQVFDTLEGYEHHYNTLHRNVCSFCKRSFPSGHLLDIHILEWHDSLFQIMAEKQNMYKCLVEGCAEKLKSSKDRKDHLVTVHLYPADFRFDRPKKTKRMDKLASLSMAMFYRIIESPRLEKPLKLLQSNHEPHTDRSQLHQIPQCWVNPTLQPLQGWGLPPCPGQPIPTPNNPFWREILPKSQSDPDPALAQLEAIPSCPGACSLGQETPPPSLHPPFREL
uniref:Zinc finger protein 511 n=1 Tax=Bubo bubo TaxID=30461 RepID=A0A8C0E6J9_BUBBB